MQVQSSSAPSTWLAANAPDSSDRHLISGNPVKRLRLTLNRRFLAALSLVFLFLFALGPITAFRRDYVNSLVDPLEQEQEPHDSLHTQAPSPASQDVARYDSSQVLKGEPTMKFRDNLLPNKRYITSWISAGWTNDVMTLINLLYLGVLTERIPILTPFTPSHVAIGVPGGVPTIKFSEVFDLPRLRNALRSHIVEWHELKNATSTEMEDIGCWSTWQAVQDRDKNARHSSVTDLLAVDISYTKAPSWIKTLPQFQGDLYSNFASLAALGFSEGRQENLIAPGESRHHHVRLPPDDHVLCFDFLYYVCSNQPHEFEHEFSPAWRFVGQHMRWAPYLQRLIDQYVRTTFGVAEHEQTPPWITIHARRGDFYKWCYQVPVQDCFAPISVIARRVEEVKQDLLQRKGLVVNHVIMTSDEAEPAWWDEVKALGWYRVDHRETAELYGRWYPVLIDAGIQSTGVGFVGTDRSTMSILARRRVQSWQDGSARIFKWGRIGADNH